MAAKDDSESEKSTELRSKEWDVFLSHASEDKGYVTAVGNGLARRGLTVLLDGQDFVAGSLVRTAIDAGVASSHLGVLFVSAHFIAKEWTRYEFEAFLALEQNGRTAFVPVWLGVDEKTVAEGFSRRLAERIAIRAKDDPEETASELFRHVQMIFQSQGTWSQLVRIETLCLPWLSRPMFLARSLRVLDDFHPHFWNPARALHELPSIDIAPALTVGPAVAGLAVYDGTPVIVTGHQEGFQDYERHEMQGMVLAERVFQLRNRHDDHAPSILYVRCAGPMSGTIDPARAPDGCITTVTGYLIAGGAMTLSDGSVCNAAYLVAARVFHTPKFATRPAGGAFGRVLSWFGARRPR